MTRCKRRSAYPPATVGCATLLRQQILVSRTPSTRTHLTDAILRDPLLPLKHDPEAFYYLDWPSDRPVKTGEYTCDLYRHQESEELFKVEVVFPKDGDVKGAVSCRVQAENLTKPVEFHIPVSRLIENFELTELAKKLVAEV